MSQPCSVRLSGFIACSLTSWASISNWIQRTPEGGEGKGREEAHFYVVCFDYFLFYSSVDFCLSHWYVDWGRPKFHATTPLPTLFLAVVPHTLHLWHTSKRWAIGCSLSFVFTTVLFFCTNFLSVLFVFRYVSLQGCQELRSSFARAPTSRWILPLLAFSFLFVVSAHELPKLCRYININLFLCLPYSSYHLFPISINTWTAAHHQPGPCGGTPFALDQAASMPDKNYLPLYLYSLKKQKHKENNLKRKVNTKENME